MQSLTCSNELHHFDTTTFTLLGFGHIVWINCVVERIMASGIFPRVAVETVYSPAIWNEKMKALSDTTIIFFNRKDRSCHWRSLGQQHEDALHQHDSNQLCCVVMQQRSTWEIVSAAGERRNSRFSVVAHHQLLLGQWQQQTFGYSKYPPSSSLVLVRAKLS